MSSVSGSWVVRSASAVGLGGARLGPVLDRDVVDLEGEAIVAVVGGVLARLEPAGEADGLALDEVLGGGLGLALPDDQVDEQCWRLAVAAVAGDGDGGDVFAAVGLAS